MWGHGYRKSIGELVHDQILTARVPVYKGPKLVFAVRSFEIPI